MNKCTLCFKEDKKLQEEKVAGLVNLITDYVKENGMSLESVDKSIEYVKKVYYMSAFIKR